MAWLFGQLVKFVPDYSKLTPEEAKNALESGDERTIAHYGGRDKLMENINDSKSFAQNILKQDEVDHHLSDEERAKYQKILSMTVVPSTETEMRTVPPRPDTTGGKNKARASDWDRKFGETHNVDGTPKKRTTAKPLTSGVEESTAEAGRGSSEFAAKDSKLLSNTDTSTPTTTPTATNVSPPTTPTQALSSVISENQNLEQEQYGRPTNTTPIVQQNSTGQSVEEPPLAPSATIRNNEAMISHLFSSQRSIARAY